MDDKPASYLRQLALFKGTPDNVLQEITKHIQPHKLGRGEVLMREGAPSDSLYIIRSGWVKIVTEGEGGQEITLNQVGPGQVIGEMSLIDQQPRSSTVVALSPVAVLEIKYDVVLKVLDQYPSLVQSFLRDMSERIRFSNAYIGEAIEWCRHIAAGNYDFVKGQMKETQATIIDMTQSHQVRAGAFLSAFFKMVEGVKQREDNLLQEIQRLTIKIDEVKRKKSVKEITETEFFEDLQASAKLMRQKREAQQRKQTDPNEER